MNPDDFFYNSVDPDQLAFDEIILSGFILFSIPIENLSVTLILTELFQHNLINVSYLTACYLYQVMMTLHFLNDVANDAESTQK